MLSKYPNHVIAKGLNLAIELHTSRDFFFLNLKPFPKSFLESLSIQFNPRNNL